MNRVPPIMENPGNAKNANSIFNTWKVHMVKIYGRIQSDPFYATCGTISVT